MRARGVLGLLTVVAVLAGAPAALAAGWTAQSVPLPAGASTGQLNGVSCTSSTSCTAVGFTLGTPPSATLAEHWNGTGWTIQPTPNPGGTGYLNAVSCVSATDCTAVGAYTVPNGTKGNMPVTIAEHWNGSSWSLESDAITGDSLTGVSCTSASSCSAVGDTISDQAIGQQWDGSSWTTQTVPDPSGGDASLAGVACRAASDCFASGHGDSGQLAEHWNGTGWSIQSTPGAIRGAAFQGVSCSSPTACTAVGYSGSLTLAERFDGSAWQLQSTPSAGGTRASQLTGVSCPAASNCMAVGYALDAFAELWNGTAWTLQPTPRPGGEQTFLVGVSCPSTTACVAVGSGGFGFSPQPLAESYSTPPATVTFGTTAVGSLSDQFAADRKRANRYSLPTGAAISNLQVYLQPTAVQGSEQVQGVIYADDGGSPGALVAATQAITFTSSESAGYHRLPFSSAVDLPPGNYWLGVLTGGTSDVAGYRYSTVAGARDYNANPFSAGASNPFGAASSDSELMSLFATYTPLGTKRFGTTTVGSSFDDFAPDRKRVNRYSLATAGTVTNLVIYLDSSGTAGSQPLEGVIYGDSAGAPDQLLGTTEPFTYESVDAAGWYDLTFKTPVTVAAGNYWLGVLSGPSSAGKDVVGYRYRTVAASRDYNANAYSAGPSNPFGPITTDGEQMSLYATYR